MYKRKVTSTGRGFDSTVAEMNFGCGEAGRKISSATASAITVLGMLWVAIVAGTSMASPCYDCEDYRKQGGPLTDPYGLVRGRCSYPCECNEEVTPLSCPEGVSLIRDGCGCCTICARQEGQSCNMVQLCDEKRLLECVYPSPTATSGSCKIRQGRSCDVDGRQYSDGETFKLDCRTQCTCQNGTYGCVSLCPHESIRPSGKCKNPQLVRIHGACCRDWLCESSLWEHREPSCARYSTPWSPCSSTCDPGLSYRITNDNLECHIRNETRICQVRPCDPVNSPRDPVQDQSRPTSGVGDQQTSNAQRVNTRGRTVRRRHVCRATVKSNVPVRLSDGNNCTSVKSYQAKFCANCRGKVCTPRLATTFKVDFQCPLGTETVTRDVMWIVKCVCENIR